MAVSACLLGELCRYDGATKRIDGVIEALKDAEIIPFCPEAPVLGTPRERISVVFSNKEGYRVVGDESGADVTALIKEQTQKLLDEHPDLDGVVLKSKSPSCGLGTTPIVNIHGKLLCYDNGVAAQMLLESLKGIDICDEQKYIKELQND